MVGPRASSSAKAVRSRNFWDGRWWICGEAWRNDLKSSIQVFKRARGEARNNESECNAREAPPLVRGRVSNPPYTNLNVAMDEDDHAFEHVAGFGEIRRVPCVSLGVDVFQGDLATGLSVIRDEALGLVPREAGIRVLVVVQHVAAALEPDRRRSFDSLPTLECEHGVTLRHVSLAAPIGVLARDDG